MATTWAHHKVGTTPTETPTLQFFFSPCVRVLWHSNDGKITLQVPDPSKRSQMALERSQAAMRMLFGFLFLSFLLRPFYVQAIRDDKTKTKHHNACPTGHSRPFVFLPTTAGFHFFPLQFSLARQDCTSALSLPMEDAALCSWCSPAFAPARDPSVHPLSVSRQQPPLCMGRAKVIAPDCS